MCRQVLPAYWFGDWHWATAHVLCLAGAVLGSVAAFAWQVHANSVTKGGAPTWLVSFPPFQNCCSHLWTAAGCACWPIQQPLVVDTWARDVPFPLMYFGLSACPS